ncbi:MAG TPA: hypothetical protein VF398_04545 [bacterium]
MTDFIKIDDWDYDKKMELELEYQLSLTFEQRFEMMISMMQAKNEYLERNGLRKPFEIIMQTE